jgi:hypothetical protein
MAQDVGCGDGSGRIGIGQLPIPISDKQRIPFRTDTDIKGRGAKLVWGRKISERQGNMIDRDRYNWVIAVRFLTGLILLGLSGAAAFGEPLPAGLPPVPANVEPATGITITDNGYIDRSHEYVDREMVEAVTWFDDFFHDKMAENDNVAVHDNVAVIDAVAVEDNTAGYDPAKAKIKKADIKLKWTSEVRAEKGEGFKFRTSVNAQVSLPHLEKMLKLVVMKDTSKDSVVPIPIEPGTPAANTPAQTNSLRTTSTELRYYAHETKTGYAFLAAGSRFVWPPETFVRTRFLTRRAMVDNTYISPSATLFWQDHLGFGATPQLEFGHPFAHQYIFVWANSATVYRNRSGFLWGTQVSLSKILSPVTAVALAIGASGATRPSAVSDRYNMGRNNYNATFKYRRKFYRPWLFVEVVPETNWRRNDSGGRDIIPAITVRLEINSEGHRALLPVPRIVEDPLPLPIHIPE